MIGGGVKDKNLCRFTANATGKKVIVGPVEATAQGNLTVQLMAMGQVGSIAEARKIQTEQNDIYLPEETDKWNAKYNRFIEVTGKR